MLNKNKKWKYSLCMLKEKTIMLFMHAICTKTNEKHIYA